MKSSHLFASAFAALFVVSQASAAPIVVTPSSAEASTNSIVTFDESGVAGGESGTLYNGVLTINGIGFAERFAGQSLSRSDDFDVLSGQPTSPLSLQAGATDQNLMVILDPSPGNDTQNLAGMGPGTGFDAIGEGSFAILFGQDQSVIGLDLLAGDGGSATLQFFSSTGGLIESLTIGNLGELSYTFSFASDYAGPLIRGVSVHNTDTNGIFLDNVRYSINTNGNGQVPEPGSLALVGLALMGLSAARRLSLRP